MRRRLTLALALLAMVACSPGSSVTVEGAVPSADAAARDASITSAVQRFISAYAHAPTDDASALAHQAASPALFHWAIWLGVQFGQVEGQVTGVAKVGSIGPPQERPARPPAIGAVIVQLRAQITFTITPPEGSNRTVTRSLDGPMLLIKGSDSPWQVADFTRDGAPLSTSVFVFPPGTRVRDRGVTIRADAFITDSRQWAIGVVVRNMRHGSIKVPAEATGLLDASNSLLQRGVSPHQLARIASRTTATGLVAFPIPSQDPADVKLVIGAILGGKAQPVFLSLRVAPLLEALQGQSGSPSPSPSA
jgi:hypothetical protein